MNRRIFISLLVIAMAIAAMTGATLAWFTAEAEIEQNVFEAGTLTIEANEVWAYSGSKLENWNPGDCEPKEVELEVTGTKSVYLRMLITETWTLLDANGDPLPTTTYTQRDAPNVDWKVADGLGGFDDWNDDDVWQLITIGTDDYWFYKGPVDGVLASGAKLLVLSQVCLAGPGTGNEYQGATYTIDIEFEAIQTTNNAVDSEWGYVFDDLTGEWVVAP